MRQHLSDLEPLASFEVEGQLNRGQLGAMLEASADAQPFFQDFLARAHCIRSNATGLPLYDCSRGNIAGSGNTFLAPVVGNSGLHVLLQLQMQRSILEQLRRFEVKIREGVEYRQVIWSRLEYHWLSPHPPLRLLQPASCVWVPWGEDYGGVNDRHAVFPRSAAAAYLGRLEAILRGTVAAILAACMREVTRICGQTSEKLLAATLLYHGHSICRFPPSALLVCCAGSHHATANNSTATVSRHSCYKSGCSRPTPFLADPNITFVGKYASEMAMANLHASAARVDGARLLAGKQPLGPGGFWGDRLAAANASGVSLLLTLDMANLQRMDPGLIAAVRHSRSRHGSVTLLNVTTEGAIV